METEVRSVETQVSWEASSAASHNLGAAIHSTVTQFFGEGSNCVLKKSHARELLAKYAAQLDDHTQPDPPNWPKYFKNPKLFDFAALEEYCMSSTTKSQHASRVATNIKRKVTTNPGLREAVEQHFPLFLTTTPTFRKHASQAVTWLTLMLNNTPRQQSQQLISLRFKLKKTFGSNTNRESVRQKANMLHAFGYEGLPVHTTVARHTTSNL